MGFAVTSLIFVVVGVIASFGAGICCNRGPSTNLYVKISSDSVWESHNLVKQVTFCFNSVSALEGNARDVWLRVEGCQLSQHNSSLNKGGVEPA
ncbi:hypothetical protein KY289_037553 [Solanum tuberosum]|nr:hypothetical protein KY289_037553 [Solanum tuberosum]